MNSIERLAILSSGIVVLLVLALVGCGTPEPVETPAPEPEPLPHWTFRPEAVFPGDGSLNRPEDGVALADGRLLVTDQIHGLRLVEADGASRPFGRFAEAGYRHDPPEFAGGANGVTLAPDGVHVIVADVHDGSIFRVDIGSEATERVYRHPFGVNMAREDSTGAIWFTQSTRNGNDEPADALWRTVNVPAPDGALCRLPAPDGDAPREATCPFDDFEFANGLALDEEAGVLWVAESMGSRVWRFRVDVSAGTVTERTLALEVNVPDNVELDDAGRLWIACPLRSEVVVYDPATDEAASVFRVATPESEGIVEEANARLAAGEPWLDLLGPALWEPAPGLVTGMILADDAVWVTGLGNAIVRLER